jgi:hypothetical protein
VAPIVREFEGKYSGKAKLAERLSGQKRILILADVTDAHRYKHIDVKTC